MPLSEKQKVFCQEYLIDFNGTQAAIRAGYSPKTANEQGARLLANVSLRAYLDTLKAERSKRTGVTADRVVQELARIAFIDPSKIIDLNNGNVILDASSDDMACIASVKTKKTYKDDFEAEEKEIKLHDKTKALELLGKHLGMFTDSFNLNIKDNRTIIVDDVK